MSANTVQPQRAEPVASAWRLVNLALGLAAVLSFVAAMGFPGLVPSRWLLAPWLTPGSMETVSPFAVLLARIGINLWLPASIVMMLLWAAGLHRKVAAPSVKWASVALAFTWLAHIALTVIQILGSSLGQGGAALLAIVGMLLTPVYIVLIVTAIAAAAAEFQAMLRHPAVTDARNQVALFSWALVPPALSLVPLLLHPGNPLAVSSNQQSEFDALCKEAGVRLMEKPAGPVRSIALDWPSSLRQSPTVLRLDLDQAGRWLGSGGGPKSSGEAGKELAFDYVESRRPHNWFLNIRTERNQQEVATFSADVVAFVDVDKPDELRKAPAKQGAVRYTITLTDRRSGAVLGVHNYVFDMLNRRACGANIDNNISPAAFIYDAIHR